MKKLLRIDSLTALRSRYWYDHRKIRENVVLIDFDNFKKLNDNLGYLFADGVLRTFGLWLKRNIRETDAICRRGGDEFIIFCSSLQSASKIADRVSTWDQRYPVSCGVGRTELEAEKNLKVSKAQSRIGR